MIKRTFHVSCAFIISLCLLLLLTTCGENPVCASSRSVTTPLDVSLQMANGMVYLGALHTFTHVQDVYEINGRTGSTNWHTSIKNMGYSYYSSSFFVGSQVLLLGPRPQEGSGPCIALRISDGKQLWSNQNCNNLLLYNNIAYEFLDDGTVTAIDISDAAHSDKLRWHTKIPLDNVLKVTIDSGIIYASSLAYDFSGSSSTGTTGIAAIRASDGVLLWKFVKAGNFSQDASPILVVTHNDVFFKEDTPTATFLYALRPDDGSVLWQYQKPYINAVTSGPNDIIYLNWGQLEHGVNVSMLEALHASNGALLWNHPDPMFSNKLFDSNGISYFESDTSDYALRSSDGKQLWMTPQEYVVDGMAAYTLYVSLDPNTLASLNTSNGSIRWQINIADGVGSVFSSNGSIYSDTIHSNGCNSPLIPGVIALKSSNGQQIWHFQASS